NNGIFASVTGAGDITINRTGTITGAGNGINASNSGASGDILINGSGDVTGNGATSFGILAQLNNGANNGSITVSQTGDIKGARDGIDALNGQIVSGQFQAAGTGNVSVTTGTNA